MNNKKPQEVLESLGFSPNEIKIYLTLNDNGSKKAGDIAKLAKIDRSSCYNGLKSLTEKGLVSYVLVGEIKWFQATGPKALLSYVKEQEQDIKDILPELQERHKSAKLEGQVRLFKGIKGVKAVFYDMIRKGEDNYVYGSEGQFTKRIPEFAKQFDRLKRENNIHTYLILRSKRKKSDNKTTTYAFLDEVAESPAVTNIYGDRVAIIIWTDEPEAILIENEATAKAYKSYFDVLWKMAKIENKKRKSKK